MEEKFAVSRLAPEAAAAAASRSVGWLAGRQVSQASVVYVWQTNEPETGQPLIDSIESLGESLDAQMTH